MKWLELKLDTSPAGLEAATQLLEEQGITGLVIDDEGDFRDFLEHNHQYWDYVDEALEREMRGKSRVTFYLLAGDAGLAKLAEVRIALQELKESRSDCGTLLNSAYTSMKMINRARREVRPRVREASASLSNCPPYST